MNEIYSDGAVRIRDATLRDVDFLKNHLRLSDKLEIMRSHNHTPEIALKFGLRHSQFCATVLLNDVPVCMFGVVADKYDDKIGAIWLLGTDGLYKMRFAFLRLSRKFIRILSARYPYMFNFVDADNVTTMRWLAWCGATMGLPIPYGVELKPFCYFTFGKIMKGAQYL